MQKTNTKVEQNTNVEQAKYTRVESVEEARKVIARIDAGEEAVEKDGRGLLIWLLEDIGRAPALCEEYRSPTGLLVGPANKTRSTDANYTPAIRTFKRVYAYPLSRQLSALARQPLRISCRSSRMVSR